MTQPVKPPRLRLSCPLLALAMAMLCGVCFPARGDAPGEAEEPEIQPSPLVTRLIEDPLTTEEERALLRVRHGRWDDLDATRLPLDVRAGLALMRYELGDPLLRDERVNAMIRGRAALERGEPERVEELLKDNQTLPARVLRAQAMQDRGRYDDAVALLLPLRDLAHADKLATAPDVVAAAEAVSMLARLQGRPSEDYHLAITLLGHARADLDPLYTPAYLAEADLLMSKGNRREAQAAYLEALALNPGSGEAWHGLGSLATSSFAFEQATFTVGKLREVNPAHPLADRLEARIALQQRDAPLAKTMLEPALAEFPTQRSLLALYAAARALSYEPEAMQATLDTLDRLAPGSAEGRYIVGEALSGARQYDESRAMLEEAIRREPNWPEPRVELGLMLMQKGDLPAARDAFAAGLALDRFNIQASNQSELVQKLLAYPTIETDHFIIRYSPDTPDVVLARDMSTRLEGIFEEVTPVYQHEPRVKTQIDLLPNMEYFAVRITGMPDIWTIAACTGDVIGMTPPRPGPQQRGAFDWVNVIRHEYVHTVTLDQTQNRIPHWFTEACAVSSEKPTRNWQTYQLLASALHAEKLFSLDDINWGFIRPKTELDRPLAYAQSHWMLEYIRERWGNDAVVELLGLFREGVPHVLAFERVLGIDAGRFEKEFRAWAEASVKAWGLEPRRDDEAVRKAVGRGPVGEETLKGLMEKHPSHPAVLKAAAEHRLTKLGEAADDGAVAAAGEAVEAYAAAVPVDPWIYEARLRIAGHRDDLEGATAALEELDLRAADSGRFAAKLAELSREAGRYEDGLAYAERALEREPYNGTYRELAATLALQAGEMDRAVFHLESIALLEPDRPVHQLRLAAIYDKVGRGEDAAKARERAEALTAKPGKQATDARR